MPLTALHASGWATSSFGADRVGRLQRLAWAAKPCSLRHSDPAGRRPYGSDRQAVRASIHDDAADTGATSAISDLDVVLRFAIAVVDLEAGPIRRKTGRKTRAIDVKLESQQ